MSDENKEVALNQKDLVKTSNTRTHQYIDPIAKTTPPVFSVRGVGEKGAGGAPSHYLLAGFDLSRNPKFVAHCKEAYGNAGHILPTDEINIFFQNGPIEEGVFNGVTLEMLLTICGHRLNCFQEGNFPSAHNDVALIHINLAIDALNRRTQEIFSQAEKTASESLESWKSSPAIDKDE